MEIKRCEKGHFYDAEANSTCPWCAAEMEGGNDFMNLGSYGVTEPANGFDGGYDNGSYNDVCADPPINGYGGGYGVTEPVKNMGDGLESFGPTEPVSPGGGYGPTQPANNTGGRLEDCSVTEPVHPIGGGSPVKDYDTVTTPVSFFPKKDNAKAVFSPVTGWLVCTEGPAKGMDYRIRAGYNYIGRSEHMDICIRGDLQISREKHALIAYDHQERVFFFGPADGKSLVRINGKMVMNPTQLNAYDVISIGETKLLFVPLCGERFNWDE